MTLVIHMSDPHFGAVDPVVCEALLDELNALEPTLVAISGDITQRARRVQFEQARAWLDRLTSRYLVVPGNHDIPFFDLIRRVVAPRERYLHYICSDLAPTYVDDVLAVCGIDTTTALAFKRGRVTREQAERVVALLAPHTFHWRIVVAHHPFEHALGAAEIQPLLEQAGVDLVLTGHMHVPTSFGIASRNPTHTMIAVHAGSCMSTRLRGEPNGYNQLRFYGEYVDILHRVWNGSAFVDAEQKRYRRTERGRERIIEEPPRPVTPTWRPVLVS